MAKLYPHIHHTFIGYLVTYTNNNYVSYSSTQVWWLLVMVSDLILSSRWYLQLFPGASAGAIGQLLYNVSCWHKELVAKGYTNDRVKEFLKAFINFAKGVESKYMVWGELSVFVVLE